MIKKHLWLITCMLLMMACVSSMSAQTKVTGNVVNERGETVEYVSIGFEEDSVGVISDAKGHFELTIPKGRKEELSFTHVSYLPATVPYHEYANGKVLTVVLKDKVVELAEVVVGKKNKPKTIAGKGVIVPGGAVGYGGKDAHGSPDAPEVGITFSCNKDYVISDILLKVTGCTFKQCTVSFNLYEKQDGKYVNILQKPIYEIVKQTDGKHVMDVRPEETLVLKRKKHYYLSIRVVDNDGDGFLYLKASLQKGLYRREVKGKQKTYPVSPAITVKGYELD